MLHSPITVNPNILKEADERRLRRLEASGGFEADLKTERLAKLIRERRQSRLVRSY